MTGSFYYYYAESCSAEKYPPEIETVNTLLSDGLHHILPLINSEDDGRRSFECVHEGILAN